MSHVPRRGGKILHLSIVTYIALPLAPSFFACPKNRAPNESLVSQICARAKKGTFLRTSRPQAKGQPRGEKIANVPTLPFVI
ncbi:hypothetical protein QNI16_36480 [Cytophagaceae bacterium YF14B1]|uniref:Uncharacterized protein n=1 Tax=Xanthocytophaga flava TaxID=3048013 RepID=A0AAE3QW18_9BACT|nr:hypothetical protein [Xanthocytophaga flavus]MDJ1486036.1 hypothetical protein [Xanthocytophaga flavus]